MLLDRAAKKIRFVRQAAAELGAVNVEPAQAALADYRPPTRFSTVVTRATMSLDVLWAGSETLLGPHGVVLAMKGRVPHQELKRLGPRTTPEVVRLEVPGLRAERHLVIITRPLAT